MKQSGFLAACALVCASGTASAQDGGMTTGGFELEYLRVDGSSSLILDGDIDLRYRGGGTGGAALGFDLGVDATFDLSEGQQDAALFAAAVGNWGFGDIAVGMPRSIGDVLVDRPSVAGIRVLDDLSRIYFAPVSGVVSKYNDARGFGLRYENGAGQLRYGASALKLSDIDGVFMEAAGEYALGQGAVEGVIEYNTDAGKMNALIGLTQSTGQFDFGVYMSRQKVGFDGTGFQASVDYRLSENFSFGGDFLRIDGGGVTSDVYGASMEYGFSGNIYGQFGFAHENSGDNYWDASVGFKF